MYTPFAAMMPGTGSYFLVAGGVLEKPSGTFVPLANRGVDISPSVLRLALAKGGPAGLERLVNVGPKVVVPQYEGLEPRSGQGPKYVRERYEPPTHYPPDESLSASADAAANRFEIDALDYSRLPHLYAATIAERGGRYFVSGGNGADVTATMRPLISQLLSTEVDESSVPLLGKPVQRGMYRVDWVYGPGANVPQVLSSPVHETEMNPRAPYADTRAGPVSEAEYASTLARYARVFETQGLLPGGVSLPDPLPNFARALALHGAEVVLTGPTAELIRHAGARPSPYVEVSIGGDFDRVLDAAMFEVGATRLGSPGGPSLFERGARQGPGVSEWATRFGLVRVVHASVPHWADLNVAGRKEQVFGNELMVTTKSDLTQLAARLGPPPPSLV